MPIESALNEELSKEAQRIEEDALFSAKGHYNAVGSWLWLHRGLAVISGVASVIAGTAVLKEWGPTVAVSAAAASTIAAALLGTLKPGEEGLRHQRAGDRYLAIRNRARIFRLIDLVSALPTEERLVTMAKALSSELDDTRSSAPRIPGRAYERAKRDIEVQKTAAYHVDKP
jgi:hypothetical protein